MAVVAEKHNEKVRESKYGRLFPTNDELEERLRSAMRFPVQHCMTKEQLLERMAAKKQ